MFGLLRCPVSHPLESGNFSPVHCPWLSVHFTTIRKLGEGVKDIKWVHRLFLCCGLHSVTFLGSTESITPRSPFTVKWARIWNYPVLEHPSITMTIIIIEQPWDPKSSTTAMRSKSCGTWLAKIVEPWTYNATQRPRIYSPFFGAYPLVI